MKETGRVVSIDNGVAQVLFQRRSMCARCGACGMGAEQNNITVEVPNSLDAAVGDEVEVQFAARNALASSAVAYIFPLLMLFLGAFVGYTIPPFGSLPSDAMAAIFACVFAVGSYAVLKLLDPWIRRHFTNVYTMIGKVHVPKQG